MNTIPKQRSPLATAAVAFAMTPFAVFVCAAMAVLLAVFWPLVPVVAFFGQRAELEDAKKRGENLTSGYARVGEDSEQPERSETAWSCDIPHTNCPICGSACKAKKGRT